MQPIASVFHRLRLPGLVLLGVFGLCLPTAPALPADPVHIRITIPVPAMSIYPLLVAKDQGFFARAGYDVEIISTSGDGPDVDALISGSADFTVSTPNRLMTAAAQGKPLLAVMNVTNRLALECVMGSATADRRHITDATPFADRVKNLRGLTLAGTRPGALTYLLAQDYAVRDGLVPQKDVRIVGIGGPPALLPAVEHGQVDVVCGASPVPDFAVYHHKAIMLTDNLGGADPRFDNMLFELLYVRPDYAGAHPDIVRGIVGAMVAAIGWIHATPPAAQLPELRARFSGVPDDLLLAIITKTIPAFKPGGAITADAVGKAAKFLIETGAIATAPDWKSVASNAYLPGPAAH